MSDDDESQHPFAITSELPDDFGYTAGFLNGTLKFDFTSSTGGGRHTAAAVVEKCAELGNLTRSGADLVARQEVLAAIYSYHYDAPKVAFIVQFLCGPAIKCTTKAEGIALIVKSNAPFIPFDILKSHLARGLKKYKTSTNSKGKKFFPPINWSGCYETFCKEVPFPSSDACQRKAAKLELGINFWKNAMQTHNARPDVPKNQRLSLSEEEVEKLSGSQFSVSKGGTPTLHVSALSNENVLRGKLLAAQGAAAKQKTILEKISSYEQQISELRDSISVNSSKSVATKRKNDGAASDDEPNQGHHALDNFMDALKHKVESADYIDFAAMSSDRLREIKMLNSTSSKQTKISAGLFMRTSLSEADVAVLTSDLHQIFDGFFYHYLKLVSESHLADPMATIMDRISWWQWMASTFAKNPAAQVKFIKSFLVDHHAAPLWTPLVKQETNLMLQCLRDCKSHDDVRPPTKIKVEKRVDHQQKNARVSSKPNMSLSANQLAKIESWRVRFPAICLSRIVRGRKCRMEEKNKHCRYSHVCAWCNASNCLATCAQAETL